MDVVVIFNGLGNQMSQYAFYLHKKKLNKSTRFIFDKKSSNDHNGFELGNVFNISYKTSILNNLLYLIFRLLGMKKLPIISKPIIKGLNFCGIRLVNEVENYDFDEKLIKSRKGITFYYGGWHSEKYFVEINDEIRQVFKFQPFDNDINTYNILKNIKEANSVSVHIRRGDFLNDINMKTYGSVCNKDYFLNAMKQMRSMIDKPHFYIFSNDINWVIENFQFNDVTIIDFNKDRASWKDMYLISNCKHHINSNSTFSWWGSYLNNNNNKKVIVPYYFVNNLETKDFYPLNWIRIKTE
jgi:hypothetical protein